MNDRIPTADDVADLVLPFDGPHTPDRVIEAARTIGELVRRVNNATHHASALRYPPQLDRTVRALRSAVYGLEQAFDQIAARLDQFAADPRVEHDAGQDPWVDSATAAHHLRTAANELRSVTAPLDLVTGLTHHLGYDTSSRRSRRAGFPAPSAPSAPSTVHTHQSQPDPIAAGVVPPPPHRFTGPAR